MHSLTSVVMSLLLLAFLTSGAYAADCEFNRDEVNPATNERYVQTKRVMLTDRGVGFVSRVMKGHASEILASAVGKGSENYVLLQIRLQRTYAEMLNEDDLRDALTVPEGAKMMILMADDSIVSLHASQTAMAKTETGFDSDGNLTVGVRTAIFYGLDDSTAKVLAGQDAMVVRIAAKSGRMNLIGRENSINFGTTKTSKGAFKRAVLCLEQRLSAEST